MKTTVLAQVSVLYMMLSLNALLAFDHFLLKQFAEPTVGCLFSSLQLMSLQTGPPATP